MYDEADELLRCEDASEVLRYEGFPGSRSFMKEINKIEKNLHHSHRNVYQWFFSSQYNDDQLQRAELMMGSHGSDDFTYIDFDMPRDDSSQRYTFVDQSFMKFEYGIGSQFIQKMDCVMGLLEQPGKFLIIAQRKFDVDRIEYEILSQTKVKAEKTHGGLGQYHREVANGENHKASYGGGEDVHSIRRRTTITTSDFSTTPGSILLITPRTGERASMASNMHRN